MKEDIDVKLSEHVAKEASHQINKLNGELDDNKASFLTFLKDVVGDSKESSKFTRKVVCIMFGIMVVLILGMIALGIYNQNIIKRTTESYTKNMVDFLQSCDISSEIQVSNEYSDNNRTNLNIRK